MSRKLASIQKIISIEPIEGADRIELAHVLGWQCVVNKGQFKPEDMAVYFEIDSFLPITCRLGLSMNFLGHQVIRRAMFWERDSACVL